MIIILEGLDATGKTTWAKKFCENHGYEYKVGLKTDIESEKIRQIDELEEEIRLKKDIVYDRSTLIDNFTYDFLNPTWRCLIPYKERIRKVLEKCIIIHFYIDESERKKRMDIRGDEFITDDKIEYIRRNYENTYRFLEVKPNKIYLDEKAEDVVINIIKLFIS